MIKRICISLSILFITELSAEQSLRTYTSVPQANLQLELVKDLRGGASFALLVKDKKTGKPYVFKQNRHEGLAVYRDALMEFVWSKVAESLGIITNTVEIVGPEVQFKGKPHPNMLGTLHSYLHAMPGSDGPLNHLDMTGTMNEITFMTLLQDSELARIAALDVVSDNADRHRGNLMYDENNQQYIAIDFGYASRSNLAAPAHTFFKALINKDKGASNFLTQTQKEALAVFVSTLEKIVEMIDKDIIEKFMLQGLHIVERYGLNADAADLLYELFYNKLLYARRKATKIIALIKKSSFI